MNTLIKILGVFALAVFVAVILVGAVRWLAYTDPETAATRNNEKVQPQISNPASSYCEQQGNKVEIKTADDGSQTGDCVFPDGSRCDEWAYFRGECAPASQGSSMPKP